MRRYPLVEVLWTDAVETGEWVEHEHIKNAPMPSRTAGYLVRESDESITVAGLVNDTHVALGLTIPRPMIRLVRVLKPASPKGKP